MARGGVCIACGWVKRIGDDGVMCLRYGIPVWKEKRTCDGWEKIERRDENEKVLPDDGERSIAGERSA